MDWIEVPITKDWLSVGDIAEYLDVSTYVVTNLLRNGGLPGVKVGREWRVSRMDFEVWLNGKRGAPAP